MVGANLSPPHPSFHHTNVCKISRLWTAISSLVLQKSLSNMAILFILRPSLVALSSGIDGFSLVHVKRWKKKSVGGRVSSLKYQYDYDYEYILWTCFRRIFLFLHWKLVYIYSRERNLRPILKEEKKLIGQYTSLRENEDLPIWEAHDKPQGKSRHVFMCARLLRVKLCTGRMRNETLMYNLNDADVHDESFESASKTYSPK